MDLEDNHIKKILKCVAKHLGIEKWHYEISTKNDHAVNYLGNLTPVLFVNKSNGEHLRLVVKMAPPVPQLQELLSEAYKREVCMYNNIIPIFTSLSSGVCEELFPKCYYTDLRPNNQLLVMNDMRYLGFESHIGDYLDSDHVNVSLKALAQFHALSMIASESNVKSTNDYDVRSMLSDDPKWYYTSLKYCVKKNVQNLFQNTIHYDYLMKLVTDSAKHMDESSLKAKRLVYGHGDFWKSNIMFQYTGKKPVRACLVDFQVTRLMSPAQDVLFLLMTGTDSYTRRQNFIAFLTTYYNELQKCLSAINLDPKLVYSEGLEDIDSIVLKTEKVFLGGNSEAMEEKIKMIIGDLITDFKELGYINN